MLEKHTHTHTHTPDGCRAIKIRATPRTPGKTSVKLLTIVFVMKKWLHEYHLRVVGNLVNWYAWADNRVQLQSVLWFYSVIKLSTREQITATNIAILCFQWRSPFFWPASKAKPNRHCKSSRIKHQGIFFRQRIIQICWVSRDGNMRW